MVVSLRPMTAEEFVPYEEADARRYAENMVRAGHWPAEESLERAKKAHASMLPHGVGTKGHMFFVIETSEETSPVGVIWLSVDREKKPPSGFIYDLLIHAPYRRRGFGRQAMLALEDKARQLGLASLALHVFADNAPARALYTSLGYQGKSTNMVKALSPHPGDQPA